MSSIDYTHAIWQSVTGTHLQLKPGDNGLVRGNWPHRLRTSGGWPDKKCQCFGNQWAAQEVGQGNLSHELEGRLIIGQRYLVATNRARGMVELRVAREATYETQTGL